MTHPYADLPTEAFWRTAVAEPGPDKIEGLWNPKWPVMRRDKIATAGSCFAQHIGRALAARKYDWVDFEPAPALLSEADRKRFNYGIFSFRTGNIYTPRMLNQWLDLALDGAKGPDPIVTPEGRFIDPMRPAIEPGGFATEVEFYAARKATAAAIAKAVREVNIFVFTLGLTECWRDKQTGFEFAACPGTLAGEFDPERHVFHNMRFAEILEETQRAILRMRTVNWQLRVLLTVSPVPLTATASGAHVLPATSLSKSILRAVAGELHATLPEVDYFPSYEVVTSPAFEGRAFAENKRSVRLEAVDGIMARFFADQQRSFPEVFAIEAQQDARAQRQLKRRTKVGPQRVRDTPRHLDKTDKAAVTDETGKTPKAEKTKAAAKTAKLAKSLKSEEDVVCEEAMLDAFAK